MSRMTKDVIMRYAGRVGKADAIGGGSHLRNSIAPREVRALKS